MASDILIGLSNNGAFTRTLNGTGDTAIYQASDPFVEISASNIESDLNAGLNVIVSTASLAANAGNISVQNSILKTDGGDASLTFLADNDVEIAFADIVSSSGRLSLVLNSDRDDSGEGSVLMLGSFSPGPLVINTLGGDITIGGGTNPLTSPARGTPTNFGVEIEFTTLDSGLGGNISILGRGFDGGSIASVGVSVSGTSNITARGTGAISINGIGGNGAADFAEGVSLSSSTLSTESGPINIVGTSTGSGEFQIGVTLANSQTITSVDGDIEIRGTGSNSAATGTTTNHGVLLATSSDLVTTTGTGVIQIIAIEGAGSSAFFSDGTLGGATAASSISILANSIGLNTNSVIQSTGILSIKPTTPSVEISVLPGGNGPGLSIDTNRLIDGFSSILLGDPSFSTGAVTVNNAAFSDPVFIFGGSITVTGGLTGSGGVSLNSLDQLGPGQDITITDGTVSDLLGDITISAGDNFVLTPAGSIDAGGGLVSIAIDAFGGSDPGVGGEASIQGTISSTMGTEILGNDDADVFNITPQAASSLTIAGDIPTTSPGDVVNIDAGGNDITFDVTTNSLSVFGAQPFVLSGIESIGLLNANNFIINGTATSERLGIVKDPNVVDGDLVTLNSNAGFAIRQVANVVFNGLGGDDVAIFGSTLSPLTALAFNGGQQDGSIGGDTLIVGGSYSSQELTYAAPGPDGNAGSVLLDGTLITYSGLEPIFAADSANTVLKFNTGLPNNATLRDNAGTGLIEIIDNGATFENTVFPNPSNSLTIILGDQGDRLTVNALDAAYAASMIIEGGLGVDNVQVNGVTISNTPGRGLSVLFVETLGITGSTFSNNSDFNGGGISIINEGSTTITDTQITGNRSTTDGGGLYVEGTGSVNLIRTVFANNIADDSGGGAFIDGPQLTANGSVFRFNQAPGISATDGVGGGLYVRGQSPTSTMSIVNGDFNNNQARGGGAGAIFIDVSGSITGGQFALNSVTGNGTTFETGGGGFIVSGENITPQVSISNLLVDRNQAPAGAGVVVADARVTITDSSITNNRATEAQSGGGGIGVVASSPTTGNRLTLTSSRVTNNTTAGQGGGIGVIDANVAITDSTISNNQANGGQGGGIGIAGVSLNPTLRLDRVTIDNNSSSQGGGGFAALQAGFFASNTTISNNTTTGNGGGIAFSSSNPTVTGAFEFSTIASNSAIGGFGSNFAVNGSVTRFLSSIVADPLGSAPIINMVSGGPGELSSQGFNLFSNSNFSNPSPSDLLGVDPLLGDLADNGGLVQTRALLTGSPAIDTGAGAPLAVDARGFMRPVDGNADGDAINDIGAFESTLGVSVTLDDGTVDESAGTAIVRVSVNGAVPGGFTINFSTANGSATQPGDYTQSSGVLTFSGAAGETQTFTIPIIDDTVVEGLETVLISLGLQSNTGIDVSDSAVLTIVDNDRAVLSIDDVVVNEPAGTATVTVSASNAVSGGFTVDFATVNGTATEPADYTQSSGMLAFSGVAGETQTFTIPIIDDTVVELSETLQIRLSSPSNPNVDVSNLGSVLIVDNDTSRPVVDLTVSTTGPTTAIPGGAPIAYTILVSNAGPSVATNVNFTDDLPAGVTIQSVTLNGSAVVNTGTNGDVAFVIPTISAANQATVVITVSTDPGLTGNLVNTATVALGTEMATDSFTTTLSPAADVTVTKTVNNATAAPGGTLQYTVAVRNGGQSTAAGVTLVDVLPAGVTFINGTGPNGAVLTATGQTINVSVGTLAPAATAVYTINAFIGATAVGALVNQATVVTTTSEGANALPNVASVTTIVSTSLLVPNDDRISGTIGQTVSFDFAALLANDSLGSTAVTPVVEFADFFSGFVKSGSIETDAGGTLSIIGTQLTYTPPTKFFGNDRFQYRLVDLGGVPSNLATVTIDVINAGLLVSSILGDPRIVISNARIVGGDGGHGLFLNGTSEGLPIDSGAILSTGFVGRAQRSDQGSNPFGFSPSRLGAPGDNALAALLPTVSPGNTLAETFDASTLEFDFVVPIATRLSFEFVFASEEYNEFVDDIFNDVFAIFLDGQNIATVPGTNTPVAINNINLLRNSNFYNDNETMPRFATAFDGFTTVLEATSGVLVPGQTYRLKIAIADVEDAVVDSAVLLRARSLGLGEGDLALSATQSQSSVAVNETITYTYNIVNNGPGIANNTVFTTTIPLGSSFVSASSTGGVINTDGGGLRLEIASMPVGQTITVQVVVNAPNSSTELTTISSVTSSQFDIDFTNNTANLTTIVGSGFDAVRGQVTCDSNGNGIVDSGEAMPNVTVFIDLNGNRLLDLGEHSTVTDNLGSYRISRAHVPSSGKANVVVQNPPSCRAVAPEIGVTRTAISTGALSRSITAADIDRDGDNDLLVVNELGNDVSVLINGGSAGFSAGSPIQVGKRPVAIDSWQSSASASPVIAVAAVGTTANQGSLYVIENGVVSRELSAGNGPVAVAIDDFNGDQQADFVVATLRSGTVVARMSGEGTERVLANARSPKSVTTADLNNDNFTDLVVVSYGYDGDTSSEVTILLGDGRGNFTASVQSIPGRGAVDVAIGDFDSDPADEIAISNYSGLVRIFDFAAGSLTESRRLTTELGIESIAAQDLNGDGRVDLVIANSKAQTIELFIDQSSGFIRNRTITGVPSPSDIVIANLDGDTILDVAVSNLYGAGNSGFTLPSSATILGLTVTEREVTITANPIIENFGLAAVRSPQSSGAEGERRFDVDRSGIITPRDALIVINQMSRNRTGEGEVASQQTSFRPDVNRDGQVTALDALLVINHMARQRRAKLAEGELLANSIDTELDKRLAAIDDVMSDVGSLF